MATTVSNPSRIESHSPNFALRRAAALGAVLLTGMLGYGGVKAVESVKERMDRNQLVSEIKNAGPQAEAVYNDNHFGGRDVDIYQVREGQSAFGVAAAITQPGHNINETANIITAQTGEVVDSGEKLVFPPAQVVEQPPKP
jgi:hypothetical protein